MSSSSTYREKNQKNRTTNLNRKGENKEQASENKSLGLSRPQQTLTDMSAQFEASSTDGCIACAKLSLSKRRQISKKKEFIDTN